jgi:recombinational DNA repair protein (RecF pathway)
MTLEQFLKELPNRRKNLPNVQCCAVCGVPLQEAVTGNRKTSMGHVCSDCYFQKFSEELDKYPIFMPRTTHGA